MAVKLIYYLRAKLLLWTKNIFNFSNDALKGKRRDYFIFYVTLSIIDLYKSLLLLNIMFLWKIS